MRAGCAVASYDWICWARSAGVPRGATKASASGARAAPGVGLVAPAPRPRAAHQ